MAHIQKITPYLWFDNQAAEAAEFYCSVFKNSRVISHSPIVSEFELEGMQFVALNGGPQFAFTEAVSFLVECADQQEVDYFWDVFTSNGGEESRCGWCKDKYGLSWQIVPVRFLELLQTGTPEQQQKMMAAMHPMNKLLLVELEAAYNS